MMAVHSMHKMDSVMKLMLHNFLFLLNFISGV